MQLRHKPGNWLDYKLELVGVQEVRWDGQGTVSAGDCNLFYGKGVSIHEMVDLKEMMN